jgi:hypothetical protein
MFDPTPYRWQKRVGASKMSNANKAAREHLQHWLLEVFQRCASRCETAQARIDLLRTYSNIVILWQSTFGLQMERAAWNSGYKQELCELDPKGTRQIVHAAGLVNISVPRYGTTSSSCNMADSPTMRPTLCRSVTNAMDGFITG